MPMTGEQNGPASPMMTPREMRRYRKERILHCLTKLGDRDTQRMAVEELSFIVRVRPALRRTRFRLARFDSEAWPEMALLPLLLVFVVLVVTITFGGFFWTFEE